MATAQQEAWESNFEKDLQKLTKDLIKELNKNAPRDNQFNLNNNRISRFIKMNGGGYTESIQLWSFITPHEKIKWSIKYEIFINKINRGILPISPNSIYTKKEIERAYKSILLKVLEMINSSF